ncbi:unnamed protein product [Rotaria magnacalcarata]|uniref:Solute carrier family 13 member 1 n=3 Tax=Rotaria magnacalcarata TaxID=392030 RepID=A0A819YNG6_9BILA|nr:unnamed protein product [Rotaria magnacalcarata]
MLYKLRCWWRLLVILFTPLILLPLPLIVRSIEARCAYIVLLLTVYWVTEAMPYAVTSLFPLALFPMTGILPGEIVCLNYFKDITTLLIGSMILAHAMNHVHLHRRVALLVLSIVGSSTKWNMAGLMGVTAFLSMWINNAATNSIMMPVAIAIIDETENHQKEIQQEEQTSEIERQSKEVIIDARSVDLDLKTTIIEENAEQPISHDNIDINPDALMTELIPLNKQTTVDFNMAEHRLSITQLDYRQLKCSFLISVAYSSAMGGLITLVGTGTNIFTKGFIDQYYESESYALKVSFANFFLFGLPIGFIMLIVCWLWLQILYNRKDYVTDGTTAILIGSLPLILPDQNPFQKNWKYNPILQWDELSKSFPWGVFMLQGAGLAIADGFKASNLSITIANLLQFLVRTPEKFIIFVVIVISSIFTEFTSNIAGASILFPILDSISHTVQIHPAYLIMSSCMAVSLSFMLPIATPPNSMIFSSGHVRMMDLIKAGIGVKIIGILVIFFASIIILGPILHISTQLAILHNFTTITNDTM